ncbi:MAG: sulfotransferase domain-containing protein [Nitrospirota bacterium]|nr:sulfotransferase domain-containing protein [Nitrospirota bacterium]
MRIVWLASYPESGNTWLRFLVYSYLYGPPETSAQVGDKIPDIHHGPRLSAPQGTDQMFVKTHLMPGPNHPFMDRTHGFVYVVRHPKDVLLSNLNYARLSTSGEFDAQAFAEHFIQHMGVESWIGGGIGTWPGNTAGWLSALTRFPGVILRYEDLKADPHGQMVRVARLIDGGKADEVRIARAVEASSMDSMRRMEDLEREMDTDSQVSAINEDARAKGGRFVNQGGSGQSLAHLGDDIERQFNARFAPMLDFLGYT